MFSGVVNLLMLAGPLYMLQIYDRVLASRSVSTLIGLSVFLLGAYAFQGILDAVRTRVVVRSARLLDEQLEQSVHRAVINLAVVRRPGENAHPVRDLDQIRAFLTSTGPIAIVDLPWMPFFLAVCFIIHPWIGVTALLGAIVLFFMALMTERASREPARTLAQDGGARSQLVEANRRNSETIIAMGMVEALGRRWTSVNDRYLGAVQRSSDVVGGYGSASKILRLVLQSAILGIGAYLVIQEQMTAGAMIAASIMMARALAPIETVIANWRGFVSARQSIQRLGEVLNRAGAPVARTSLAPPTKGLEIANLAVAGPGMERAIVAGVGFTLGSGEALGVIGPSGCGKTSLGRVLVGVWPAARGTVRLDGAALDQWTSDDRGRFVGYVSQSIELFEGTVAENIARMDATPDSGAIVRAAEAAGAHDMILQLPAGYDTPIGEAGASLSGGQRQRIALARALYGDPFLIVLDEPNSNLDNAGEVALLDAIRSAKARGAIVVLIAHRPSVVSICDKVLVLAGGTQKAFGPRDEVLREVMAPPHGGGTTGPLKVVGQSAPTPRP